MPRLPAGCGSHAQLFQPTPRFVNGSLEIYLEPLDKGTTDTSTLEATRVRVLGSRHGSVRRQRIVNFDRNIVEEANVKSSDGWSSRRLEILGSRNGTPRRQVGSGGIAKGTLGGTCVGGSVLVSAGSKEGNVGSDYLPSLRSI
ncbi:hypothetical protein CLOM_g6627 [Closterium sp. NIES-68]|nr:hypothetical protein CLOM_g6627 [Closterium sp. NIES-68]GJP70851.1 hypothetical protein CLOP_g1744 [Closterium sp. NIES-67]